MSRIARKPIILPSGVTLTVADSVVTARGPKGELQQKLPVRVTVTTVGNEVWVRVPGDERGDRAAVGLSARLVANLIHGVVAGWSKQLELIGIGFRAEITGGKLVLNLGFTHPVTVAIPSGIEAKMEKNTLTISSISREQLGQFAAVVRHLKPPEPYKGKGIRYVGEVVRRKVGKQVKGATAGAK